MLVTALLLPATLGAACVILSVLGMSFNMMTLGGMACIPWVFSGRRQCWYA